VPAPRKETLDLKIEVLAAQNLAKAHKGISLHDLHPFVRVDLHVEDRAVLPTADRECELQTGSSSSSSSSSQQQPAGHADSSTAAAAARFRDKQVKEQEREGQFKLRTRSAKGSDADFGGEELRFRLVPGVLPELVFVRFIVRLNELLQKDTLLGWACVRLDRLRQGYRLVHLLDDKGRETEAVLLVKVTKTLKMNNA
jgi:hypothetical protein